MKQSRFNVYCLEDGVKLAFNSYTCALAIVDDTYEELLANLKDLTEDNIPTHLQECYESAKLGHFIVDDEFDELNDLLIKRRMLQHDTHTLGLTIAPTLACNFKCIYCYESAQNGVMTESVQDAIVAYVENQKHLLKCLDVSWYGGEPLLSIEVIRKLSNRLMEVCQSSGVEYVASMVTNGYLLDESIVKEFSDLRIRSVQVTLDGPARIHNNRRVNKSGKDSFNVIVENINLLLKHTDVHVGIRINIDKNNKQYLRELFETLSNRLISKKVQISFGQVSAFTEACKNVESSCFTTHDFASELLEYHRFVDEFGFREYTPSLYPEQKLCYCCADFVNAVVVDPQGFLYKCWNQVGSRNQSIGNITDKDFHISNYKNARWTERNPIMSKCGNCCLLPICMGGCPYNNIVLNKDYDCDVFKYNLEKVMRENFRLLNN